MKALGFRSPLLQLPEHSLSSSSEANVQVSSVWVGLQEERERNGKRRRLTLTHAGCDYIVAGCSACRLQLREAVENERLGRSRRL
eukprot:m.398072 g.398072  ORF g.398072 m.398072 type:complete len:85 (-) comp56427_c1_seq18:1587-1841(-)